MWKNQFFEISYVPILIFWMNDSSFQSYVIVFITSHLQDKWRLFNLYYVSIRFSKVINISSFCFKKSIYPWIWSGYPTLESTFVIFLRISFYQNFHFCFLSFPWRWMIRHLNSGQFSEQKWKKIRLFQTDTEKWRNVFV